MAANDYEFLTRWRVEGTREEVYRVLEDTPALPVWWPAVWLKVVEADPGDEKKRAPTSETAEQARTGGAGVGSVYHLTAKGWLPYILRWTMTTTEKVFPERIAFTASGDFLGRGVWTIRQDGPAVAIEHDWRLAADKPLLKHLSFLFKPAFRANHGWAMRKGEESLRLELARRRAATDAEKAAVPAPPGPTFLGPRKRRKLGLG